MPNTRQNETARLLREYFPGSTLKVGPSNITVSLGGDLRFVVQPVAVRKEKRIAYASDCYRAGKDGMVRDWVRITSYTHATLQEVLKRKLAERRCEEV